MSNTKQQNAETAAMGARRLIVYDCTLFRPACVLIQAARGGADNDITCRFPTELWLTNWTPNMKTYPIPSDDFLDALIAKSIRMNPELMGEVRSS